MRTGIGCLAQCMSARAMERGGPLCLLDAAMQADVSRRAAAGARRAAVLIPIAVVEGEPSVVFSVRSGMVSTHQHQVAFPGGHVEPGESHVHAAFREASEELGGSFRSDFFKVDYCHDVLAITGTVVTPVVAVRETELCLDDLELSDEVASVFALSVRHLLDEKNRHLQSFDERGDLPVFHGGPERIWGLTAFILDGVLRHAVLPCVSRDADADVVFKNKT